VLAVVTGAMLSWFASTHPDGLEWSIVKTTGVEELPAPQTALHRVLAAVQEKLAFLPDYGFRPSGAEPAAESSAAWPAPDAGTSVAGLVGAVAVLALVVLVAMALRARAKRQ
jgi:cobalt/nickel transport system permease protein